MQKGFVIILILAVVIGIFAISNSGVVAIDFIFTEVLLSQAIVIFICVLLGALIASVFGWIRQMSLKKEIKELKNENERLEVEKNELIVRLDHKEKEIIKLNSEIQKDLKEASKDELDTIKPPEANDFLLS